MFTRFPEIRVLKRTVKLKAADTSVVDVYKGEEIRLAVANWYSLSAAQSKAGML